ncbi:MAG: SRPBCC family protein [Undibacterium sp.]|nr:SRPBCC family protein [Opitutaceae bacterium]
MSSNPIVAPAVFPSDRELVLTRVLNASRQKIYQCWTDPKLITQWFTPPPFTTPFAETNVRGGGSSLITMRGPDGTDYPNRGVYLEVVPNERLVFTDAYVRAWEPSEKPFMTAILTFEDAGAGKTLYTARVRHWSVADCRAHEKMGFHDGWGVATTQLEALASRI